MLVLYLSNKYIRAILGSKSGQKMKVKAIYTVEDTNNCILNGVVTDEDAFLNLMARFWQENNLPKRHVVLLVDGNRFNTKTVELPVMTQKKMLTFVRREMADVNRIEDPVIGYQSLPGVKKRSDKMQEVFAIAVERTYVTDYVTRFQRLGIRIDEIMPITAIFHRFTDMFPSLAGSTFLIQFVDDITITNLLFVDGNYQYSNRNRLYSEQGSPSYPVEIARSVSNILQFSQAQNMDASISKVFINGLNKEDMVIYKDTVSRINPELTVDEVNLLSDVVSNENDEKFRFPGVGLAIGGLGIEKSLTGIISQLSYDEEKEAKSVKRKQVLFPVAALLVAILGFSGYEAERYIDRWLYLLELQEYNNSIRVNESCDQYDKFVFEADAVTLLNSSIRDFEECVMQYPYVDSRIEGIVQECARGLVTAIISSYDSTSGIMTFDTLASDVEQIHRFVALLSEQDVFANVDYSGYRQNADGYWQLKVNCTMAGRQEDLGNNEANGKG
ncbi:MAG: hypothetical protein HUJ72_12775 [Blautia sp.]|nr:hypothetical protein [Blautia sp.]